jgi:hypothetical protein
MATPRPRTKIRAFLLTLSIYQPHDFLQAPNMIRNPRFHCWRNPQSLTRRGIIVVHETEWRATADSWFSSLFEKTHTHKHQRSQLHNVISASKCRCGQKRKRFCTGGRVGKITSLGNRLGVADRVADCRVVAVSSHSSEQQPLCAQISFLARRVLPGQALLPLGVCRGEARSP